MGGVPFDGWDRSQQLTSFSLSFRSYLRWIESMSASRLLVRATTVVFSSICTSLSALALDTLLIHLSPQKDTGRTGHVALKAPPSSSMRTLKNDASASPEKVTSSDPVVSMPRVYEWK
eukprot:1029033-Prymnesium_polylepis.1